MIKPEFWQDEKIGQLPILCRLLYIGLWNLSDDYGVAKGSSVWIKGQLFPYDGAEVDVRKVEDALDHLEQSGRIVKFMQNGEEYYDIPKFREHQVINRPSKQRNPSLPADGKRDVPADDPAKFPLIVQWNYFATEHKLPLVKAVTDSRKRAIKRCKMGMDGFMMVLAQAANASFLMGKTERTGPHKNWKMTFDWVIKEDSYTRILEGQYDDGTEDKQKPGGYSIP